MRFLFAFLLVLTFLTAVEVYFYKRLTWAFDFRIQRKKLLLILLYLNLFPFLLFLYFAMPKLIGVRIPFPTQSTILNRILVHPSSVVILIVLQSSLVLILLDFLFLLVRKLSNNSAFHIFLAKKSVAAVILIFAFYVPVRIVYDYYAVDVSKLTVEKPDLPEALDGFKIALISDIHADNVTGTSRLSRYVKKTNELSPDLILIAGDIISHGKNFIHTAVKSLENLHAAYGVYSCVGDHDNWVFPNNYRLSLKTVKDSLASVGIQMLDNETIFIPVDSSTVQISFVTNNYVTRISNSTLQRFKPDSLADISIFLTHQPRKRLLNYASTAGFTFYFCGHTHGGQITFLFPFVNLTPTMLETPFVKGFYKLRNTIAYVVRGLGMSILPVRYNSTPEIAFITLKKADY